MSKEKTRVKQTKPRGTYPPSLKRELAVRYLAKEFVRWYKRLVASKDAD